MICKTCKGMGKVGHMLGPDPRFDTQFRMIDLAAAVLGVKAPPREQLKVLPRQSETKTCPDCYGSGKVINKGGNDAVQ